MNKTFKMLLKVILAILLLVILSIAGFFGYIALRYSPQYVYREIFMDLGTVYDYRLLPERSLAASPQPFSFEADTTREGAVQAAFQRVEGIASLEVFLAGNRTQAFLVIQDGTLIYERYFNGQQRDSLVTSYSVAKSFDSALVGIAIQEGLIGSVDDPVTRYLPELLERDPRFADIQIRHLLMMASGLRYNTDRFLSLGDDNLTYQFNDLRRLALEESEILAPPASNCSTTTTIPS
jgi:CubicO group peptidase (beta-lactamase class C family)